MEKKITKNDVYQFFVDIHDYMMADAWQDTEGFSGEINIDYAKNWIETHAGWAPYKIKLINLFNTQFR